MSKHGGRRHGLSTKGASPATKVRLGPLGDARLAELACALGLSGAEVLRRLIAHPSALVHAREPRTPADSPP